jgi:hypothetical protein
MRLYHYTCVEHLPSILDKRVLRTTESNVSLTTEHAGPDVVWLSSDPGRPPRKGWADGSFYDKTRIRITVELPVAWSAAPGFRTYVDRAVRWIAWAYFRDVDRVARRGLILAGGGTHYDWWVIERPVTWDEIVEIRDMEDDTILDKE